MLYQEYTICSRKDPGRPGDKQLYFTTGQNLNSYLSCSQAQLWITRILHNTDRMLLLQILRTPAAFNTDIVSEISSKPLKEAVLSLLSDSMPWTCATHQKHRQNYRARKEGVIDTQMHIQCSMWEMSPCFCNSSIQTLKVTHPAGLLGWSCLDLG